MRTIFIGIGVFLLYLIPARWHYTCQIRQLCDEQPSATALKSDSLTTETLDVLPPRVKDLSLSVGDSVLFKGYENFGFMPNSATPILSENNRAFLDKLAEHLKNNPDQRLGITGNYYPDEKVEGVRFDNVGIARAAAISSELTQRGLEEDRFKLDYQTTPKGNSAFLERPISYNMILPKKASETKKDTYAEASYTFTRMTFSDINFEYNSEIFKPSRAFDLYADSVKTYLVKNPKKKVNIIGHADDRGAEDYNYGLGLRRANRVRIYLIEKGIDDKRVGANSEGETKPIVPNNSEANMRKNRRVEIIIK